MQGLKSVVKYVLFEPWLSKTSVWGLLGAQIPHKMRASARKTQKSIVKYSLFLLWLSKTSVWVYRELKSLIKCIHVVLDTLPAPSGRQWLLNMRKIRTFCTCHPLVILHGLKKHNKTLAFQQIIQFVRIAWAHGIVKYVLSCSCHPFGIPRGLERSVKYVCVSQNTTLLSHRMGSKVSQNTCFL